MHWTVGVQLSTKGGLKEDQGRGVLICANPGEDLTAAWNWSRAASIGLEQRARLPEDPPACIQSGACNVQRPNFLSLSANHRGTSTGTAGRKGPALPWAHRTGVPYRTPHRPEQGARRNQQRRASYVPSSDRAAIEQRSSTKARPLEPTHMESGEKQAHPYRQYAIQIGRTRRPRIPTQYRTGCITLAAHRVGQEQTPSAFHHGWNRSHVVDVSPT